MLAERLRFIIWSVQSAILFVTMYLDYAESQAERNIPMTMEDWAKKLNAFLQFNEKDILENAGNVTAAIAKEFAESEFEKYRIIQDRLFQSDFDRLTDSIKDDEE
ncbi:MAG TPA: virulence protein [Desulfosporosinus sp.]|nr:virulence protein [Desulfosporosinus sp.]